MCILCRPGEDYNDEGNHRMARSACFRNRGPQLHRTYTHTPPSERAPPLILWVLFTAIEEISRGILARPSTRIIIQRLERISDRQVPTFGNHMKARCVGQPLPPHHEDFLLPPKERERDHARARRARAPLPTQNPPPFFYLHVIIKVKTCHSSLIYLVTPFLYYHCHHARISFFCRSRREQLRLGIIAPRCSSCPSLSLQLGHFF
ncbi:hypothetical protein BX666DRAFT_274275 [Dichotomocladium elegans]|nr:hypothetical protein BX666DRAFT_274275 [Dichotomocladium elegans]